MKRFIAYIQEHKTDEETRIYFPCDADDADHAEEQALNAYPDGYCVTIFEEI